MNLLRKITIRDRQPSSPPSWPIHVGAQILFDDAEPTCLVGGGVQVLAEPNDGTTVTLHVLASDVHVEPIERPEGHQGEWDRYKVLLGEHDVLVPLDGIDRAALAAADPDDLIPVTLYVAEVHFQ